MPERLQLSRNSRGIPGAQAWILNQVQDDEIRKLPGMTPIEPNTPSKYPLLILRRRASAVSKDHWISRITFRISPGTILIASASGIP